MLYGAIAKNQNAYDAYNSTNYYCMGLAKQRRTLLKGNIYGLFNDIFTTYSGYVNEEHASLMQAHFFKIFNLDAKKKTPTEMINTACAVLEENIKKIADNATSILDSEVNRKNVLETFGIVIKQVSQQFLTEDWSSVSKQTEKETLYQAIIAILNKFQELSAADNLIIKQFVAELLSLSFASINHTLVLQSQGLEKDYNCLQESIDNRLKNFFSALLMQLNHSENSQGGMLEEIIKAEEYTKLSNHPSNLKIAHIYNKLNGKGLEQYSIEQLTKSYEEQFANSIEDFAKLHQQIQIFIYDLAAFRSIIPSQKIDVDEVFLFEQAKGLMITAAERFYKDRPQALPPMAEKGSFMELAEQHAIEHFGVIDRYKEKNKGAETESAAINTSYWSLAYSFFSNPMRTIYGPQATAPAKVEVKVGGEIKSSPP